MRERCLYRPMVSTALDPLMISSTAIRPAYNTYTHGVTVPGRTPPMMHCWAARAELDAAAERPYAQQLDNWSIHPH
jgi:hypothetical protein